MIKAVLFDMDGTLLPLDLATFTDAYMSALQAAVAPKLGHDPRAFLGAVGAGIVAMANNDGTLTNRERFLRAYGDALKTDLDKEEDVFSAFYQREYLTLEGLCTKDPAAKAIMALLKKKGIPTVLATNAVFPLDALRTRVRWAGVDPGDFVHITSYESSHYTKPNPAYYTEIAQRIGVDAAHCLMVGNDVMEDMAARKAGMQVYLVTPCLINRKNEDISSYPQGDLSSLIPYIEDRL